MIHSDKPGWCWLSHRGTSHFVFACCHYITLQIPFWTSTELPFRTRTDKDSFLLEILVLRIHSFFAQAFTYWVSTFVKYQEGKRNNSCPGGLQSIRRLVEAVCARFCRNPGQEAFSICHQMKLFYCCPLHACMCVTHLPTVTSISFMEAWWTGKGTGRFCAHTDFPTWCYRNNRSQIYISCRLYPLGIAKILLLWNIGERTCIFMSFYYLNQTDS